MSGYWEALEEEFAAIRARGWAIEDRSRQRGARWIFLWTSRDIDPIAMAYFDKKAGQWFINIDVGKRRFLKEFYATDSEVFTRLHELAALHVEKVREG